MSTAVQPELTFERTPLNAHQAAWWAFRAKNPRLYDVYVRLAQAKVRAGRRFGIKALTEDVRWEVRNTWGQDEAGFKLNNNWPAYIARDLITDIPECGELIETRRVHGSAEKSEREL